MFNWDLYILDPFFIILGFFFLALLYRREKEQKSHLVFYLETLLVWIVNFILVKNFSTNLDQAHNIHSTGLILLGFLASTTLLTIILKPLATWATGKIHHRRVWMWAAICTTFLALIISHIFATTDFSILTYVGLALLISFSISSQSLYYLHTNEQFYYRMFPVFTSIKIGTLIALAFFIGSFFYSLNHSVQGFLFPTPNLNCHYLYGFCYGFIIISFGLSFYKKENVVYVHNFEPDLLKIFKPFDWKVLVYLMVLAFFWGLMFGLIQSKVLDFFFVTKLKNANFSATAIVSLFSLFKDFYLVPTFIFGYLFYNYVYKHFDTFQTTLLLGIFLSIITVIAAFTRSWIVVLIANIFFGIALSQMFYLLFGFAMMWNYRVTKSIPITGFVASGFLSGSFVIEIVILFLRSLKIGIFADYSNVSEIVVADDLSDYVLMTNGSAAIVFACLYVIILIYSLSSLMIFKKVAGESLNLVSTINKMEEMDRRVMIDKLKSKLRL